MLAFAVAMVLVPVAAVVSPAPAGAAPSAFSLAMATGTGVVTLPNIEEPLELLDPTTLSGSLDGGFDGTGAVTDVQLDTPNVIFVTEQEGYTVNVVAHFDQAGSGTGTVVTQDDDRAAIALDVSVVLTLDLDIGGSLQQTCVSQPIDLALRTAQDAPYDPSIGQAVVRDDDFTIPPVGETDVCIGPVANVVNGSLAGAGNTITMALEGALDLPPAPGEPSTTVLASTESTTSMGQPATFTATVAPGEGAEATDVPTGEVEFLVDGDVSLGLVGLDTGGQAVLATSILPAGSHQITARYLGDATYSPSLSGVLLHTVAAVPTVTAPFPVQVLAGGAAQEFTATITNPGSGEAWPNLRMDVDIADPFGAWGAGQLVLEAYDGSDWEVLPMTSTGAGSRTVRHLSYPDLAGLALAAGETLEVPLRITASGAARSWAMAVQVRLVSVDPGDGEVVDTLDTKDITSAIVPLVRRATSVALAPASGSVAVGRQGYSVGFRATIQRSGSAPHPGMAGTRAEIFVDGVPVPTFAEPTSGDTLATPFLVPSNAGTVDLYLPRSFTRTLAPGSHTAQVRFSGDANWAPSVSPELTFAILTQPTAAPYLCSYTTPLGPAFGGARLEVVGDLPAVVPAGEEAVIGRPSLRVVMEASVQQGGFLASLFASDPSPTRAASIAGANRVDAFGGFTYVGPNVPTNPNLEQVFEFTDLAPDVTIDGVPGDVVDLTVDAVGFVADLGFAVVDLLCIPAGEAVESFGSLTAAGTSVVVDRPAVTVGDAVSLTASVFPSSAQGFVEFLDVVQATEEESGEVEVVSETSLGIAPLNEGTAALRTRSLPAGERLVVARHLGDLVQPATSSEPVVVSVRAIECLDFAEAGDGATVRLVYLELLRRCPDQVGFDYWVGQLESGTSAEVFARSISVTPEAVGVVVDDAYRTMLGRRADASGKAFWVGRMISGTGRYDQLLADLAASGEFWSLAGGTNEGFVTRVYDRLLNRAPDQVGLDYWSGRLDAGASRRALVLSLANLDEPLGVLVRSSYGQILDRVPTPAERGEGITFLRSTGDRSGLYAELIGRPEFATRAQSFPNRD